MPAMLIRHKVADYEVWKPAFDAHEHARRANGSRGGRMFRKVDDPNEVVILLDWDDLERARLFADSDDLRETMRRGGVADGPDIWFLTEGDRVPV
jgi:heme-degrading monooxygenase HmoA